MENKFMIVNTLFKKKNKKKKEYGYNSEGFFARRQCDAFFTESGISTTV